MRKQSNTGKQIQKGKGKKLNPKSRQGPKANRTKPIKYRENTGKWLKCKVCRKQ